MEVRIKDNNGYVDADWTIEDGIMVVSPKKVKFEPKDGDVVYAGGNYDYVFIYKDDLTAEAYYYVSLSLKSDEIELPDGGHISYVSQLRPATEEEKKLLFDKLKEEGYEWDAENKKLIKLKWRPKEGDSFWMPYHYTIYVGFKPCNLLFNKGRDEELLNKGWCFKTKEECQEFCNRLNNAINQVKS